MLNTAARMTTEPPSIDPVGLLGQHFIVVLALWLFVFWYFAIWRFLICSVATWRSPNFLSAVLGFTSLGWVVAILRDARWMTRLIATLLYGGALAFGVLAVIVICVNESARSKPWSRKREW